MTAIALSSYGLSSLTPPPVNKVGSGIICGANLSQYHACYLAPDASGVTRAFPSIASVVAPPATPTFTAGGSGSPYPAIAVPVSMTYLTAVGETTPCPVQWLTLTSGQQVVVPTISSIDATVIAANIYVFNECIAQIAVVSGTLTGATATYVTTYAKPAPLSNTAFKGLTSASTQNQHRVHGFAASQCLIAQNDAVTLFTDIDVNYANGTITQAAGTPVYASGSSAGGLDDTPSTPYIKPCGFVIDSSRVRLHKTDY
jgi:hypothetical protein